MNRTYVRFMGDGDWRLLRRAAAHLLTEARTAWPAMTGRERAALRLPRANRGDQSNPRLLGEVLALAAWWQSQLPDHAPDERLVAP